VELRSEDGGTLAEFEPGSCARIPSAIAASKPSSAVGFNNFPFVTIGCAFMACKFGARCFGSNDNYHHISAKPITDSGDT
jgi:hypothetical protein